MHPLRPRPLPGPGGSSGGPRPALTVRRGAAQHGGERSGAERERGQLCPRHRPQAGPGGWGTGGVLGDGFGTDPSRSAAGFAKMLCSRTPGGLHRGCLPYPAALHMCPSTYISLAKRTAVSALNHFCHSNYTKISALIHSLQFNGSRTAR